MTWPICYIYKYVQREILAIDNISISKPDIRQHLWNIRIVKRICYHDDFIKWKHFPRYWTFVRGIHRSLVNSPHKGQWRGALVFSLICAWIRVRSHVCPESAWLVTFLIGNVSTGVVTWSGHMELQRLPSGNRSCSTPNLISVCTLKQSSGGTSCGFTNIKSNWNMSRSDWKCSPVHKYWLNQSKWTFPST